MKHKDDEKNKPVVKMYVIENELRITLNKVLKWQYFILARNFYHFATTKLSPAYSNFLPLPFYSRLLALKSIKFSCY